jgi:hypothetical protein
MASMRAADEQAWLMDPVKQRLTGRDIRLLGIKAPEEGVEVEPLSDAAVKALLEELDLLLKKWGAASMLKANEQALAMDPVEHRLTGRDIRLLGIKAPEDDVDVVPLSNGAVVALLELLKKKNTAGMIKMGDYALRLDPVGRISAQMLMALEMEAPEDLSTVVKWKESRVQQLLADYDVAINDKLDKAREASVGTERHNAIKAEKASRSEGRNMATELLEKVNAYDDSDSDSD